MVLSLARPWPRIFTMSAAYPFTIYVRLPCPSACPFTMPGIATVHRSGHSIAFAILFCIVLNRLWLNRETSQYTLFINLSLEFLTINYLFFFEKCLIIIENKNLYSRRHYQQHYPFHVTIWIVLLISYFCFECMATYKDSNLADLKSYPALYRSCL